ncbi:hypothetical protein [Haliangium sp.]|uniref:hypothetical protein n=1 Tax=Haliangium sp. TaxID=2663208 RepID=UPI003D0F3286
MLLAVTAPALLDQAQAAAGPTLFGIRAGITDDPDTVFLGGHVAIYPSAVPRLRIEPSLELGFGDDADIITLRGNANFKVMFPINRSAAFYPLAGLYLYYIDYDEDVYICNGDCSDTEAGLNLGAGFEIAGFGIEISFGLPDYPDITATLSYTFW